jgi:hypothetical protein
MPKSAVLVAGASVVCLIAAIATGGWAALWFSIGAFGFVAEAVALSRKEKGDTLSETVWAKTQPIWLRIPLGIFMVWLTLHFVFRL